MDMNTAAQLASSEGIFVKYNDTIHRVQLFYGDGCVYLHPEDLGKFDDVHFKDFLTEYKTAYIQVIKGTKPKLH
jgi:hypothetical protein